MSLRTPGLALGFALAFTVLGCSPSKPSTSTPPAAGTGAAPITSSAVPGDSEDGTPASAPSSTTTTTPEIKESDCPPRCSESGAWVGCGLEKPRGKGCGGCVPRCKSKGSAEEGWYDCSGVFIATAKCAQ